MPGKKYLLKLFTVVRETKLGIRLIIRKVQSTDKFKMGDLAAIPS